MSDAQLSLILTEIMKTEADVRSAFSPRVALEMSLLRLGYLSTFRSVDEAIALLSGIPSSAAVQESDEKRKPEPPSPSREEHAGEKELEEEMPGWEIQVGPREAVDIPAYLKAWK